jgi:hypothetical protein
MSLGQHGVLTTETARTKAFGLLAAVKDGKDPAGDRQQGRKAPTVAELAKRFDKEHITVRLKPGTAREYRRNLRRFILPAIGRLKVADVTKADIARLHHELRRIPYQANRNLEVISKMFNLAELWGLRPDGSNPRRHIKKYPEEKRERYLSPAELAVLGEALALAEQDGVEDPYGIAAIRLLIFTGCRLNEIMTLKWDHVPSRLDASGCPTPRPALGWSTSAPRLSRCFQGLSADWTIPGSSAVGTQARGEPTCSRRGDASATARRYGFGPAHKAVRPQTLSLGSSIG